MKKIMVTLLVVVLLLSGCTTVEAVPFETYLDQLLVEVIDAQDIGINLSFVNPEAYGIEPGHYELGFNTLDDYETSHTFYKETIKTLKSYKKLEGQEAIDRDVLISYFESHLDDAKYYDYLEGDALGYARSMIANIATYLEVYQFRSEADVLRYLNFIETLPIYLEAYAEFEIERQSRNTGYGQEIIDEIIQMAKNTALESSSDDYFLIRIFNEKMGNADFDGSQYIETHRDLLKQNYAKAYQDLADVLSTIEAQETQGLYYSENGQAYYEYALKQNTGLDMSVKEINVMLQKAFTQNVLKIQSVDQSLIEVLYTDDFYPHYESGKALLDDMRLLMRDDFPEIGPVNYVINQVDPSMAENASPAYYFTPYVDYDVSMEQYIFINGVHEDSLFNTYAHEGFPGHMYQFNYNLKLGMHPIRNILTVGSNSEGWANYVENYVVKYVTSDAFADLYTINETLTQIVTVMLDIGIHYEGWHLDDMVDYLIDMGFALENATTDEFKDLYIYIAAHPAVYPMYYVSSIYIQNLKEEVQKSWDDYSDYKFHEAFLNMGSSRFDVIASYLD